MNKQVKISMNGCALTVNHADSFSEDESLCIELESDENHEQLKSEEHKMWITFDRDNAMEVIQLGNALVSYGLLMVDSARLISKGDTE